MSGNKIKALICDDSPMIRAMEKNALQEVGVTDIAETKDGQYALPLLESEKFDIMVLDWVIPKVQGIEVAKTIREGNGPNKNIAILMVTAEATKESVMQISQYKVDGYVVKPFTSEILE